MIGRLDVIITQHLGAPAEQGGRMWDLRKEGVQDWSCRFPVKELAQFQAWNEILHRLACASRGGNTLLPRDTSTVVKPNCDCCCKSSKMRYQEPVSLGFRFALRARYKARLRCPPNRTR